MHVLLGNKLTERKNPTTCSHHLHRFIELESEGIKAEADDGEEKSTDAILLGARILRVTVYPVSLDQLFPEMSLGNVYMLRSVGSLTTKRTTQRQVGAGLGHVISLVSISSKRRYACPQGYILSCSGVHEK